MSVIKVENLSKSYLIGHNANKGEKYQTLRDTMAHGASNLLRKTRDMFNGRAIVQGDEVEEFWALKNVSFEVNQGDRIGIIGRNGAGKSTLLKILSRITEPTKGRITIKGRVASLLEVGTGFHPELSGRENIFLNGAILGMTRKEIQNKFDEIIAFAEVEKFLDTPVKRYSSGMYVRLAFAVAAHLEPEILIVDEVLAVGDAQFQKKCLGKMEEVGKEGRTVLFVSHNTNAIEQLCNRVIMLENGGVTPSGDNVRDAINKYLSPDIDGKSAQWVNDNDFFHHPAFSLLSFGVFNESGQIASKSVPNNEHIAVRICGSIEEVDSALQVGVALYDESNNLIFWSIHNDTIEAEWPRLKGGKNTLSAEIPIHFLNEGNYRVELIIALYYRCWIVEPLKNSPSIFFSVKGGLSDSPYWTAKRPGIMAPKLKWFA